MNLDNPRKLNIKTVNHGDQGSLSVVDFQSVLPFDIKRCFYIYDVNYRLLKYGPRITLILTKERKIWY